ncbi:MAG TPA: glutathione-disulfide reductase, partial [Rhodospirillaceae bacterium]|nr:glutathione-disulfide reductase [Rhodospirillaceae bacterium]
MAKSPAKSKYDYDLFVIGGGSGGVRCARFSAQMGVKVGIAEERYWGGTCVNVGCVPKKLFTYAAHFSEDVETAKGYGWYLDKPGFDWPTLRENKDTEIGRLNGIYDNLLSNAGCDIYFERAEVIDPHTVKVGDKEFTTENILIATGGWPFVPDFPGKEHVVTSNEMFHNEAFPKKIVIVGGGYIAVEFAGIMHGLGAEVTQLYRGPLFLRGFDDEVRQHLADEMVKKGINLRFNEDVASIDRHGSGLHVTLTSGEVVKTQMVMYSTGRKPLSANMGLEEAGVELARNGAIVVNDDFQTTVPSIYALGDVIGRVALTPVALAEGMVLAKNLFSDEKAEMNYEFIPTAVFSAPNIGTVGFTEEQAKEKFGKLRVYTSRFTPMKHSLSSVDEKTFMKLIVDDVSDRVVGVHMVGPEAGEIMQGIGIAVKAGATKADFDATIGIHPTSAEELVT